MNTKTITSLAVAAFATAGIMTLTSTAALAAGNTDTATANASATVITPIMVDETTALDFGDFTVGASGGTVVLDTSDGTTSTPDVSVVADSPASGAFAVTGEANHAYTITLPADNFVSLTGPGTDMDVTAWTDSYGGSSTTDGSGADSFTVGATLHVNGSQTPGSYSATYDVTVAYP